MPPTPAACRTAENRQHGSDDFRRHRWQADVGSGRALSPAQQAPPRSASITNSSTTWRRAPRGGTSRPSASTSICTACSSSSEERSHERASRRGDGSAVPRDHQRPCGAGHQRRRSDRRSAAVPHQSDRREERRAEPLQDRRRRTHGEDRDRRCRRRAQRLHRSAAPCAPTCAAHKRGGLEDTAWVFGLVVDCDADKGKGGHIVVRPSFAIETSPGIFISGICSRGRSRPRRRSRSATPFVRAPAPTRTPASSRSAIASPVRPTFPRRPSVRAGVSLSKPTRIVEHTGRLWDPDELLAAFARPHRHRREPNGPTVGGRRGDAPGRPARGHPPGRWPRPDRSELFHKVVAQLERRHWTIDAIVELLEQVPERHRREVRQAPAQGGRAVLRQGRGRGRNASVAYRPGGAAAAGAAAAARSERRTARVTSSRPSVSSTGSCRMRSRRPSAH